MKTSNVLASVLFSTMAIAAPLDKRAYATKTEIHMEYYTVYTTVTGVQPPPAATSDPALSYEEKPKTSTQQQTTVVTTSSSSSFSSSSATPSVIAPKPSTAAPSVVVPTTTEKKPEPTMTSVYTPPPAPTTVEAPAPPKPTTAQAPPPSTTAQAPPPSTTSVIAQPEPTQPSSGGGQVYSGGSYTMNYYGGADGACGDQIHDSDMAVALAVNVFGDATVDFMTGKTTNPWCGKKIEITNGGKTAIAYVVDRCEGCTQGGLDATPALWQATTDSLGGASGDRVYSMSWKVIS